MHKASKQDKLWVDLARRVSLESKDRSTKVGAALVMPEDRALISTGWNGFPRGVNDNVEARHERPAKYLYTEHAERNAIYNAARLGIKTKGSWLYLSSSLPICCDCARAIVQAGIEKVLRSSMEIQVNRDWSLIDSYAILIEGGVDTIQLDY